MAFWAEGGAPERNKTINDRIELGCRETITKAPDCSIRAQMSLKHTFACTYSAVGGKAVLPARVTA